MLILLTCGNIESNPGPRGRNSCYNFSICHWNLNIMTAHNFEKINLLEAINKFDVICLSESYRDLSIASDKDDLNVKGYNLYRADHPNNVKRGGVCAYIRESLTVRCFSNAYLQECLILEISINNKKGYVVSLYRSPSQTPDEFDSFINNFEKLIIDIYSRKADFVLMIGDFNAKSCNWSINDTTTPEGAQLDSITSLYGMKQLISEPTHILQQSSSCIDLIFTNQPNIVMDSGVDSSLHPKCHHQIIYSKLNLKIEYPPPYIRKIWNYNRAETDLINRAIENCDWPSLFLGKNVHQQVEIFNKTLLNIFHNYIPNKFILCDNKTHLG